VEARHLEHGGALKGVRQQRTTPGGVAELVLVTTLDTVCSLRHVHLEAEVPVYDLEVEDMHSFCVRSSRAGQPLVVHNSEYLHLDNSACNLASLNLLTFVKEDGTFHVDDFQHAVDEMFTGQEILVGD